MTIPVIITICILLLLAYIFDLSSAKTKIPSVILLLALGWAARQMSDISGFQIPDLTPILPIIGTIGLILIVLEGSLGLELDRSKLPFIGKSAIMAILPMLALCFGLAFLFEHFGGTTFRIGLANAIPLSVISSAIAIPSVQNLNADRKEFVVYESSLSDIFGVILFNFVTLNNNYGLVEVGNFFFDLIIILIVTLIATLGLAYLLGKITHHVKFVPIILMIILIYSVSKQFHLPALIYILLFGLFLANIVGLKRIRYIRLFHPDMLIKEVAKFKELTSEVTFLIRALFFLLFGFLIQSRELFNVETALWAIGISAGTLLIRYVFLRMLRLPVRPLLFVAPRGLISILLFLSIPAGMGLSIVGNSLLIQIIILMAFVMMVGLMFHPVTRD